MLLRLLTLTALKSEIPLGYSLGTCEWLLGTGREKRTKLPALAGCSKSRMLFLACFIRANVPQMPKLAYRVTITSISSLTVKGGNSTEQATLANTQAWTEDTCDGSATV
jgi:hypothetical protein